MIRLNCSKANSGVGRKGKVALFRRLVTWGEGRLKSKSQLLSADQRKRAFKEEFQGCTGQERELHAEAAPSARTIILKLVMQWSDQHHLVLGTVSPQFQDQFLPTSLSPVLRTVEHGEARVVTTVWSPRSSLLTPGGSSASTNSSGDMAQNRV